MPALYTNQVFPGGRARTLIVSATAGNVITNLSPGVGLRWLILRGKLTLTTDATVANRNFRVFTTDGTNVTDEGVLGPTRAASGTISMSLTKILGASGATGTGFFETELLLGEILLSNADQLRISVLNGVAGDSYSGRIVVLEMAVD